MKEIIEKFEDFLKYELNYSENTIKIYNINIKQYFDYINDNNISYKSINKSEIIAFLKYLDSKKYSNRTISNKISSIKTFYNYLLDNEYIEVNMFKTISNPKIEKKLPNFMSYEQIDKILDSIVCENEIDYRNKCIVELLYVTGMRVSELANIIIDDINFSDNSIKVNGKGNKERIVYFGNIAKQAINNYLNVRSFDSKYLLLNTRGNKISSRSIEKVIDKIVLMCSIKNKITPHTFRHTFATHLLNNGADIKSVQELLGHKSLNTTQIYTHITSDYLKSQYLKNMPRK